MARLGGCGRGRRPCRPCPAHGARGHATDRLIAAASVSTSSVLNSVDALNGDNRARAGSRSRAPGRCRRSRAGRAAADGAAGARVPGSRRAKSVEVERVGPEMAEVSLQRLGRTSQTPARFFLPASVSTSCAPPSKRSRNIGVFGPFAPGARNRSLAGAHQVDAQDEVAAVDGEQEVLAAPFRAVHAGRRGPRAADRRSSASLCAGPACSSLSGHERSSSRTHASTSGSSGIER